MRLIIAKMFIWMYNIVVKRMIVSRIYEIIANLMYSAFFYDKIMTKIIAGNH